MPRTHRIILADPSIVSVIGLTKHLAGQKSLEIVHSTSRLEELLPLIESKSCDLLIVDFAASARGADQIRDLLALAPDLRVLVYTSEDETSNAGRYVRAGALGYLMKTSSLEDLDQAIEKVLRWELSLGPAVVNNVVEHFFTRDNGRQGESDPVAILTDRQREIFRLIGFGKDTKAIAAELQLSSKTVEAHRAGLREKLGLGSGHELYIRAARWVDDSGLSHLMGGGHSILMVGLTSREEKVYTRVFSQLGLTNPLNFSGSVNLVKDSIESGGISPILILIGAQSVEENVGFLQAFNGLSSTKSIPKIVLSSQKDDKIVLAAFEAGASGFFRKPDQYQEALELLKEIHRYWSINELPVGLIEECG